ncbi:MAG: class I SAM-dependent methyltransferase [Patulibacter minatonensis]
MPSSELEHAYVAFNENPLSSHQRMVRLVGADRRVLDAGCSSGYLTERLVRNGCTVVGLEYDAEAAAVAGRWCEQMLVGDIETMDLPLEEESFDVVLCGDLIEHLRNPQAAMARLRPFLRPGGRLVLSTPNVANWSVRLMLLFGRFRYTERGLLDRTHTHLFTRKTLREAVEAAGYDVLRIEPVIPVPGPEVPPVSRLADAIGRRLPGFFAYQFVVEAQRR